jgi:hypothetical protein
MITQVMQAVQDYIDSIRSELVLDFELKQGMSISRAINEINGELTVCIIPFDLNRKIVARRLFVKQYGIGVAVIRGLQLETVKLAGQTTKQKYNEYIDFVCKLGDLLSLKRIGKYTLVESEHDPIIQFPDVNSNDLFVSRIFLNIRDDTGV